MCQGLTNSLQMHLPISICPQLLYTHRLRQRGTCGCPLLFQSDPCGNVMPTMIYSSVLTPATRLSIIDDKPRRSADDFTAADRRLLHDLADMIASEFQLGFEARRRRTESDQADYLAHFLSSALVAEDQFGATRPPSPLASPGPRQAPTTYASEQSHTLIVEPSSFSDTAHQLRLLTLAHSAAILDLRNFAAPVRPRNARSGTSARWGTAFAESRLGDGSILLMGSDGDADWDAIVDGKRCEEFISSSLSSYYRASLPFRAVKMGTNSYFLKEWPHRVRSVHGEPTRTASSVWHGGQPRRAAQRRRRDSSAAPHTHFYRSALSICRHSFHVVLTPS